MPAPHPPQTNGLRRTGTLRSIPSSPPPPDQRNAAPPAPSPPSYSPLRPQTRPHLQPPPSAPHNIKGLWTSPAPQVPSSPSPAAAHTGSANTGRRLLPLPAPARPAHPPATARQPFVFAHPAPPETQSASSSVAVESALSVDQGMWKPNPGVTCVHCSEAATPEIAINSQLYA